MTLILKQLPEQFTWTKRSSLYALHIWCKMIKLTHLRVSLEAVEREGIYAVVFDLSGGFSKTLLCTTPSSSLEVPNMGESSVSSRIQLSSLSVGPMYVKYLKRWYLHKYIRVKWGFNGQTSLSKKIQFYLWFEIVITNGTPNWIIGKNLSVRDIIMPKAKIHWYSSIRIKGVLAFPRNKFAWCFYIISLIINVK